MSPAGSCVFCKIAAGEIPATVVKRADGMLAFKDLSPQAPTHLLAGLVERASVHPGVGPPEVYEFEQTERGRPFGEMERTDAPLVDGAPYGQHLFGKR